MQYWIEQLGFWGYMQRFPLNPITIIAGVVVIGIIILIINAKVRINKALKQKPLAAAVLILQKRNSQNDSYADNVRVNKLNGEQAQWFFYKLAAAIWLPPGQNRIEVFSEWARQGGSKVTTYRSEPVELTVVVSAEKIYAIHYHIKSQRYLLTEGDQLEDLAFEQNLASTAWLI